MRAPPSAHHSLELTAHTRDCALQQSLPEAIYCPGRLDEIYNLQRGRAIMRAKPKEIFASQLSCSCVYVWIFV